jgi:outer membrane lipase/esterase
MHWNPTKLAALTAALLLSACGGGGSETSTKVTFTSLVSFGDSLSDVGTYKVGTIAAVGGGKFTVNNNTSTSPQNWTEFLAGQLNLSAPCAAETGILPNAAMVSAGIVSVAVAEHNSCTNYAQGSARVTSTFAPSSVALQSLSTAANLGLMAVPVKTQIANHLSRVTQFSGTELVTVLAGANDAFMHLNAVSAVTTLLTTDTTTTRTAAYGAAVAAGWSTTLQGQIIGGTPAATLAAAAPAAAVTGMATAATELAGYVKNSIVGKGAKYVVVVTVPNIVQTPRGQSLSASAQTLLGTMVTTYNSTLTAALPTSVVQADAYAQGMDQYANPAQYGLTNVTTSVCSATGNILAGSSLVCNSSNLVSGTDFNTYQFADDVHPTVAGYKLLNRFVALKLAAAGWL